jgi:hypothetical protein
MKAKAPVFVMLRNIGLAKSGKAAANELLKNELDDMALAASAR